MTPKAQEDFEVSLTRQRNKVSETKPYFHLIFLNKTTLVAQKHPQNNLRTLF